MAEADVALLARRRQNRRLAILAPALVLMVPLGLTVGVLAPGGVGNDVPWWVWAAVAVPCLVPVAMVGALLWARKRGVAWMQPPLILGVDPAHRKRIMAAVRHGRHLEGLDERIALDTARRMARTRWLAFALPVFAAYVAVSVLLRGGLDASSLVPLAGGALALLASPLVWRDARRALRFVQTPNADLGA